MVNVKVILSVIGEAWKEEEREKEIEGFKKNLEKFSPAL